MFTMYFLKKIIETAGDIIILHLYTKNPDDMIQFLRYRVWKTEIGNHGSFHALYPPPPSPHILKKLASAIFYQIFIFSPTDGP